MIEKSRKTKNQLNISKIKVMKKLALNVIVLGVIGTAFGLTSCNLFGSKETKTETEVKNDTITTIEDSVKIDSVGKDSVVIKDSTVLKETPVKVETTTTTTTEKK